MAVPLRSPALPKLALGLGVAGIALIPFGFLVVVLGDIASLIWRSAALITGGLAGLALVCAPGFAIAATVTGHISRLRYPMDGFGRAGFILGLVGVGLTVFIGALLIVTWMSIGHK